MGKTFVALAVAASCAWATKKPAVVMAPVRLIDKWKRDATRFEQLCVKADSGERLRFDVRIAESGAAFLKCFDDPEERSPQLVLLANTALHRSERDPWVRLAAIKRALSHTAREAATAVAQSLMRRKGGSSYHRRVQAFLRHLKEDLVTDTEREELLSDLDDARMEPVLHADGEVDEETRRRRLRGFNSPLQPDILVASEVMAEGLDLHLDCRHVVHHDLSWNPSTLEQRTGRVDRLRCRAEADGESIYVYLPYLEGTADEKMYRVVSDRARWFQVVMGERYRVDEASTEKYTDRVPFPEVAADELMFDLRVVR
jgi:hypothetical protein